MIEYVFGNKIRLTDTYSALKFSYFDYQINKKIYIK